MNSSHHPLMNRPRRLVAFLLLAGLLLRGLVPAGFMPDWQAAMQGAVGITICSATGATRLLMIDDTGLPVTSQDSEKQAHLGCAFVPVDAVAPLLLALVLLLASVWPQGLNWPLVRYAAPACRSVWAGHGARAPPASV